MLTRADELVSRSAGTELRGDLGSRMRSLRRGGRGVDRGAGEVDAGMGGSRRGVYGTARGLCDMLAC
jgi:hypothetical protein